MNDKQTELPRITPYEFRGPISQAIMTDPVIASDGNTYEREWIERQVLVYNNPRSPINNSKDCLLLPVFIPNNNLRSQIDEFIQRNKEHKEFQEEYEAQKKLANEWKKERKQYLSKPEEETDKTAESKIATLFSQKGEPFSESIKRCQSNECETVSFWNWLKKAYETDRNSTEKFIKDINDNTMFQTLMCYNYQFRILSGKFDDINALLSISPQKIARWLPIIKEVYTLHPNASFKQDIEGLGISLQDIDQWKTYEESQLLMSIIAYSTNVEILFQDGNFSEPKINKLNKKPLEQLKQLKAFDPNLTKEILKTHWQRFGKLNDKDQAAIPFYKWVNLWKKEKENSTERSIFDVVLKKNEGFYKLVKNIRKKWFCYKLGMQSDDKKIEDGEDKESSTTDNSNKASNDEDSANRQAIITPQSLNETFDQTVSIEELWTFYVFTNDEDRKELFNNGLDYKVDFVHQWLINGEVTPKQLLEMFSDQKYKDYYGNYITAYGTEELGLRLLHYQGDVLGQSETLKEFYAKKTKQLFEDGLKKMGVLPRRMQIHVQVTDTHIFLTCENAIHFNAMQALLNAKSKSIPNALSFNENNQSLSIEREKADETLQYIRETIENTDKENCQKILAELQLQAKDKKEAEQVDEFEPSSDSKSIDHRAKKNHETDDEINNKSDISLDSLTQHRTEQRSSSSLDFIKHFVKGNKTSISLISMASGVGFCSYGVYQCITTSSGISDIKFFDTNAILAIAGVTLFMVGVGIACNRSKKTDAESDLKQVSNMNNV